GHFMVPGYLLQEVFDPTGAGDCFAGGFIGYLAGQGVNPRDGKIAHTDLRRAVIYGSVMGSFCCEKFGVDRFRTLTRSEVDARYQDVNDCTDFECARPSERGVACGAGWNPAAGGQTAVRRVPLTLRTPDYQSADGVHPAAT